MSRILLLKASTKLGWKMERLLCPLPVNNSFQNFLTTSLLLLSLTFQDSTF
jgi:hypothetical protein